MANFKTSFDAYDTSMRNFELEENSPNVVSLKNSTDANNTNFLNVYQELKTHRNDLEYKLSDRELKAKSGTNSGKVDRLEVSYDMNKVLYNKYLDLYEELNKLKIGYDTKTATVKSFSTSHSILIIVWVIIFLFLTSSILINIIEEKKEMNVFSRFILVVSGLTLLSLIFKNIWNYFKRVL